VYSWYTAEQIKKFLEEKITHHIVDITDIYIKPGNFTNDVYVCVSDLLMTSGVSSYYGYELECMTESFAYGASYAISAPESEWDDLEWTCYYVDSVLSYSDIVKNTEPIVVDSYVNVVVAVETDDLYDNDTISTHSSMPELIDADDADDDEDMDVDHGEDEESEVEEEESDAEDADADEDVEEEEDGEDADEDVEEEEQEESDAEDAENPESDDEICNVEHNISQVLDWVVLKCDLNDTKTVIRLLIALNYMNILINCALILIIQSF
jgi:hypothetical protein